MLGRDLPTPAYEHGFSESGYKVVRKVEASVGDP